MTGGRSQLDARLAPILLNDCEGRFWILPTSAMYLENLLAGGKSIDVKSVRSQDIARQIGRKKR